MTEKDIIEVPQPAHRRTRDSLRILLIVSIILVFVAVVVALIVSNIFPVMRINGSSMSPTIVDGDIVVARKTMELDRGDICAFYVGDSMLCKRVVGLEGDVIEIDDEGTVFVNNKMLDEPYLKGKSLGECNIEFPYTVPENSYFVLGDNRRISLDSRNQMIGCISEEQIVGKLLFCVWPLPSFGKVE